MLSRLFGAAPVPAFPKTPFPNDAQMFFCIGAQEAGTTWLHDYLSQSPQVHFSPNKELHYFDVRAGHGELALQLRIDVLKKLTDRMDASDGTLPPNQVKRIQDTVDLLRIYTGRPKGPRRHQPYLRYLLKGRTDQPVVGDITPAYAVLNRENFADMASIGQAKFVFILRDLISRMWSQIRMAMKVQHGTDATPELLAQACRERAELLINSGRLKNIERADYARTITELEAAVPAERIKYVFYENLFGGGAPEEICDFLGIDPLPVDGEKRVNEGVKLPIHDDIKATFAQTFAPQYDFVRARFGDGVPGKWELG